MALKNLASWNVQMAPSAACGAACGAADKPAEEEKKGFLSEQCKEIEGKNTQERLEISRKLQI